jgi:DNA-binding NarL/FixJ family response regulator
VVLTAHFGEGDIFRAVDAGAHSYILKGSTHNELIDAIRLVHEGNSHFPENVAAAIARRGEVKPLSHGRPLSLEKSCRGCQIPLSVGPAM